MIKKLFSLTEFYYWLAGFVDGEGCFDISNTNSIRLTVANNSKEVIEYICGKLNKGSVHEGHKRTYASTWRWVVGGTQLEEILHIIAPLLRVKNEQAELLIEFQESKVYKGEYDKIPLEVRQRRDEIIRKLHVLKVWKKED